MKNVLLPILLFCALVPPSFAETFIVDTPTMCVEVEKVEDNRVYLRKPSAPCPLEGPGKASVEMEGDIPEIHVYVDGKLWKKLPVPLSSEDISNSVKTGTKQAEQLSLPENVRKDKTVEAAEDVTRFFQSQEFRRKIDAMKEQLYQEMKGEEAEANPEQLAKTPAKLRKLSSDERIYLFVSSSVPVETLRNYVRAVSDLGDPNIRIVLRGFVGGASKVAPTIAFLQEMLLVEPDCDPHKERCRSHHAPVIIDPLLFRRYRIGRVPAFVYIPSVSLKDRGMSEGIESNTQAPEYFVLYGDTSLAAAVRLFAKEKKSPGLEGLLEKHGE